MHIAFYAPMKSPFSPRPSGDRKIARLFMAALEAAGYRVELASDFRSWEGDGDQASQRLLQTEGQKTAEILVEKFLDQHFGSQPNAWFTYHLYHKAPDWIGPLVANALGIPYFVAEASISPKHRDGSWQTGFESSVAAIRLAAKVFCINPRDIFALESALESPEKLISVSPFLARNTDSMSASNLRQLKIELAAQYKLNPDQYWLLTVAMMREDSKLESYRVLAESVENIQRKDWQLIVVGDGVAETLVRELFRNDFDRRVHFIGRKDEERIDQLMQASDLFVWPAINEALGMVMLEALSNGLPVVCGRSGGVGQIVEHGTTGLLVEDPEQANSPQRLATAIESLLGDPSRLANMRNASVKKYQTHHQLGVAAQQLAKHINQAVRTHRETRR